MGEQPLLPNSQPGEPGVQPAQPAAPPEDLTPYKKFIQHDTWKGQIKIIGSQLMSQFMRVIPYMESVHVNQFKTVNERIVESGSASRLVKPYVSRTVHHQLAAIVRRYLPNIIAEPRPWTEEIDSLVTAIEAALTEAEKIEKMAKAMIDASAKDRGRGNVRFVDSLTPAKVSSGK